MRAHSFRGLMSRRRAAGASAGVALLVLGGAVTAHVALAATACTTSALIADITSANGASGGGTVTLSSGCTYTLTASNNSTDGGTGLPVITGKVTVVGSGATIARSSASGTPTFRFFDVGTGGQLTVSAVSFSNGNAAGSNGGGAILNRGTLAVSGVTFANNAALLQSGVGGGAIDNHDNAHMTVSSSTFIGNQAAEGGAIEDEAGITTVSQSSFINNKTTIYGGGGFESQAAAKDTLVADTFTGNTGTGGGGGVANAGTMTITDSTITGNHDGGSEGGGGIQNTFTLTINQTTLSGNDSAYGANLHQWSSSAKLTLSSSIVANGVSGSNCGGPPIIDNGYNVDTGTSCGFSAGKHSLSNTQPQLGTLASNGGPTQTMALPLQSPAVDVIPTSVSGCSGGTDQRGITRPQGKACDVGAYEVIQSSGDTQPPSVPAGLTAPSVQANSVSLQWKASTDNVGVTGYTVYRNGTSVGSTGGAGVTSFTDTTASPSTVYTYTVDAFDGANNHSAQSAGLKVTTPAPSGVQGVQGGSVATAARAISTTLPLTNTVYAGDLLVGWFGQYDATGQVQVSDNVNGVWTRGPSTTFSSGLGDIAMYYVQNSAASPYGVTVTIAASSATFLQGAASDYSGIAKGGALDQTAVARAVGTAVDSGPTGTVSAGELVVGGILTGGSPGATTPGTSQGQTFNMRTQTTSGSAVLEDVLSSAAGAQDARATLTTSTDWYALAATFHPFGGGDTQAPSTPSGLTAGTVTASSAAFSWTASTDNVGVTGYTVYRNNAAIGTTSASTTSYTDSTVQPSTAYSYTVDAFDAAGNHSAKSTALPVTTPAAPPVTAHWVQGGAVGTGSKVASVTIAMPSAVGAGDLLAGWFGQYDSTGQVMVSDNVNGAWTRSTAVTTFGSGGGDIAMFYLQNSKAAPGGLTVTISAGNATYLQGSAADYAGVATSNSLDQTSVAKGSGTSADSGATGSVASGELLVGGFMTGTSPGTVTATGGLVLHDHTGSYGEDDASVIVATAGAQHATWTLQTSADWYTAAAVFRTASGSGPPPGDTQPPTQPTGLQPAAVNAQSVSLTWTASSDNVGVTGYTVYRNGTALGTTNGTTTSYTDSTVSPSTTYSYTVDAYDAAGNHSVQSTALPVTTPAQSDTQAPTTPTGLTAGTVTATSASFSWTASSDNVLVTGYTVYRGGTKIGTTSGTTTTYTDSTVLPSTAYSYTVDAYDAAGNHSVQSAPLPITTPAAPPPSALWVQGGAVGTGSKVASVTISFPSAVTAGDLLVGWFGQYDSTGQVQVSDNVNGAWTRSSVATTFSSGGDIAMFYLQNAKAAPSGLTVTISAAAATYLQGSASDFSGMATANSFVTGFAAKGSGTAANSGATGTAASGELLVSGFMTGTSPGTVTAGGGLVLHDHTGSYGEDDASAFVSSNGTQQAAWTLQTSADWYVMAAVFHTAAGP